MENEAKKKALDEIRQRTIDLCSSSLQAAFAQGEQLDKTLVSLSGGGLVFSMTFVSALAPSKHLLSVLFAAWAAFTISIISVVLAIRRSQTLEGERLVAATNLLKEINEVERSGMVNILPTAQFHISAARDMQIIVLNRSAILCFLVGVTLLAIFVGYNLWVSK